ncbi:CD276 antigen homolog isoform X2 [Hypomesus transpacificus]|uniref:CD276 antigen homolog isoform X2 n=1 Tax=Hypomesus transpacificus TaxID=137520 RepID=UPI001F084161|nr:CD276 antigen homolog isoform X2 [Hypomesus transpacificus]
MLFAVLGVTFLVGTRFIYAMARGSHPATVVGGDVTLPCSLEPGHYAKNMTIVWRTSEQDKYVHLSRLNDDGTAGQIPSYKYRTKLFGTDELMKGNISLKLSQVKLSDAGNYTCFLKVAASPVISVLGASDGQLRLQCEATTWYRDANVEWWDSEGDALTAEKPIVSEDNKHYNVRSYLTVPENKTDETFTCRVYQANKTAQARSVEPPEKHECDTLSRGYNDSITIPVIALLIIVGLLVWIYHLHRGLWVCCLCCLGQKAINARKARNSPTDIPTAENEIPLTT